MHTSNHLCWPQVGYDMAKKAADAVYRKSGCRPEDVDVIELHDCFSANELITYEALGLCPEGESCGWHFFLARAAVFLLNL